ncbi:MAG: DUF465 domain-containing protein [Sphingomonadaceae bacterium]
MHRARIEALNARHATIEGMIADETLRPLPDTARISRLKREKLKVKEQIREIQ